MKFDPTKHKRRSTRLKGYDYSGEGMYHVVVRSKKGECMFGEVVDSQMKLSQIGRIAERCWIEIPEHFTNVVLDLFQIMPNHIHGIVVITSLVWAIHESPIPEPGSDSPEIESLIPEKTPPIPRTLSPTTALERRKMLLPKMVGRFKMNSAKRINELRGMADNPVWQRGYYEHIIRDGKDLDRIRRYIIGNPMNWHNDDNFPGDIRMDHIQNDVESWRGLD